MERLSQIAYIFAKVSIILVAIFLVSVVVLNISEDLLSEETLNILSSSIVEKIMFLVLFFGLILSTLALLLEAIIILAIIILKKKITKKKMLLKTLTIAILSFIASSFILFATPNPPSFDTFEESCRPSKTTKIEANMSRLRTLAEIYKYSNNNSYSGFENDPQILPIRKHIEKCGGSAFTININPDGTQYCAVVKLPLSETSWYCIDSTGAAKTIGEYTNSPNCSSNYYTCE